MGITACEGTNAVRLTVASRGVTPAGIASAIGTPAVGSAMADHPLPAIGTTYDPPASSFDVYA